MLTTLSHTHSLSISHCPSNSLIHLCLSGLGKAVDSGSKFNVLLDDGLLLLIVTSLDTVHLNRDSHWGLNFLNHRNGNGLLDMFHVLHLVWSVNDHFVDSFMDHIDVLFDCVRLWH